MGMSDKIKYSTKKITILMTSHAINDINEFNIF